MVPPPSLKAPPPPPKPTVPFIPNAKPTSSLSPTNSTQKQASLPPRGALVPPPPKDPPLQNSPSKTSSPSNTLPSGNGSSPTHPLSRVLLPGSFPSLRPPGHPSAPRGVPPPPPKEPPPQPPKSVPPPHLVPNEPKKNLDDGGTLQRLLHRGRLQFTLLEARELRHKGKAADARRFRADVYVRITVGTNSAAVLTKRSKTIKKSGVPVQFQNEVLSFDLINPAMLVTDGDVQLTIEVFDENLVSDELLGEAKISALRFLDGALHRASVSIALLEAPSGEIDVEIKLEKALVGMLSIVLMEGRSLKSMELIGKQDPYCHLSIGKFSKRSKTVARGGRNPYFGAEELLFWLGDDLWTQLMSFRVFDQDIGSDDLIGEAKFSVLHFMAHRGAQEHVIPLHNHGSFAGEVVTQIEFFPAGELVVRCHAAKQLRSVDAIGRQDPYVKFTLDGNVTQVVKKTKTDTDGGSEPEWENEVFRFDIVDQYSLQVEVWDEDSVSADDLIGSASLSLLPIFRYGYADDWLKLYIKGRFGNVDFAGLLRLEMSFEGPEGVAYPQHQDSMDRFTEKERHTNEAPAPTHVISDKKVEAAMSPKTQVPDKLAIRAVENSSEFSEDEVLSAFRFLDIDKNSFIGAAELRHLLICMGELITDAEVDEMLRLCDTDGDGQVSFDEFRRMALHPDPSGIEFGMAMIEPEDPVPTNDLIHTLKDKERLLEMKQEKSKLMRRFVETIQPSLEMLQHVARTFREMQHDTLTFDDFCFLFDIEPTGEYRRLFALFTPDNQSDYGADLREILLAAVNFIPGVDRTQRVRFCFEIFDDDHNNFITEDELVNILRANYLASSDDQVRRKAQTILRQADSDGDGRVSLDEFIVISRKFPNLLFPPHGADGSMMKHKDN